MNLDTVFGTTGQVTGLQECARAALIFFFGLLLIRLAGRRVFGKWAALDIIVSVLIGLHGLLAQAAARSARLSHLLEGRPIPLGTEGRVVGKELVRHAVSEADLREALRNVGLEEVADTRRVVLEPSGKISVLKRG